MLLSCERRCGLHAVEQRARRRERARGLDGRVQRLADERVERRAPAGPAAHLDVPEAVPGEARR
jgi:hypothetical protein